MADLGLQHIASDERHTRQVLAQAPPTSSVSIVPAASGGNSTETQRQAGSDRLKVTFFGKGYWPVLLDHLKV